MYSVLCNFLIHQQLYYNEILLLQLNGQSSSALNEKKNQSKKNNKRKKRNIKHKTNVANVAIQLNRHVRSIPFNQIAQDNRVAQRRKIIWNKASNNNNNYNKIRKKKISVHRTTNDWNERWLNSINHMNSDYAMRWTKTKMLKKNENKQPVGSNVIGKHYLFTLSKLLVEFPCRIELLRNIELCLYIYVTDFMFLSFLFLCFLCAFFHFRLRWTLFAHFCMK